MTAKRRQTLISGLREGRINALTSCELITYGLDVPRVEVIIMLRPTLSRALYFQMIGRGLRVWPGKKECIILDHVNNLLQHGHPLSPHEWNFTGREKKISKDHDKEVNMRLCPELDYMYCDRPSCRGCPYGLAGGGRERRRAELESEDATLTEVKSPVKLNMRPIDERRQYVDKINNLVTRYHAGESGPIAELLAIAESLGRHPMWVYRKLSEGGKMINVSLLHEIARIKGYKPGWVWFQKEKILKRQ
jgi:superfamily II DNA or RNA helicase